MSFATCVLLVGCVPNQQSFSNTSLDEKDRIFESHLVKKFNEINRLKNRTKIAEANTRKIERSDIFYQQINGGKL